ncbi:MAG TPA: DUF4234 domain-containing protein [Candidatus Paceibacterota bacterium]|nr:DUF4234 domain-containing protein [Candidatus Paceibacterota bacterium]
MIEESNNILILKKKNVFVLILLSIITLGIYPNIWYIKRQSELNQLNNDFKINRFFVSIPLLLVIFILLLVLVGFLAGSTIWKDSVGNNFPIGFIIWFFLILFLSFIFILFYFILIPFKFRKVLNLLLVNKGSYVRLSGFLTLVFNVFYLQYEINRILDYNEMKKRLAPWIIFVSLIILYLFLSFIFFNSLISIF